MKRHGRGYWLSHAMGLALMLAGLSAQAAKPVTVELPSDALLVYQPSDNPEQRYHPVVLLPYTGGSGQDLYRWKYRNYFSKHGKSDIAFILPPTEGDADDYATGEDWAETVQDWEEELQVVLNEASARLRMDRERVVLAGHSMGGDMAWALMQRKPDRYAGAVIMGSRCNWRQRNAPEKLAERMTRVAFSVGEREREVRRKGAQLARGLLEKAGVNVLWDDVPGSGHHPAHVDLFARQLDFVLDRMPVVAAAPTPANTGP